MQMMRLDGEPCEPFGPVMTAEAEPTCAQRCTRATPIDRAYY